MPEATSGRRTAAPVRPGRRVLPLLMALVVLAGAAAMTALALGWSPVPAGVGATSTEIATTEGLSTEPAATSGLETAPVPGAGAAAPTESVAPGTTPPRMTVPPTTALPTVAPLTIAPWATETRGPAARTTSPRSPTAARPTGPGGVPLPPTPPAPPAFTGFPEPVPPADADR